VVQVGEARRFRARRNSLISLCAATTNPLGSVVRRIVRLARSAIWSKLELFVQDKVRCLTDYLTKLLDYLILDQSSSFSWSREHETDDKGASR